VKPSGVRRCAIYTRKSSEQGLEQDFNSLDAQREAAIAYIASQKYDGWKLIETHYDDGGWSGGNMDRPALKALLVDMELGKVDIVVVYKVDRLTRSLADFAKLIEIFDRKGASFVSVTQQFNTTTSMGRLTLNVLLSFAQFEREVTGERIRDKVLASKKKGIFMGGNPPFGYDIGNRRLNVNESEAEQVRAIFGLYLELRCVSRLKQALERKGMRSKAWVSSTGRSVGGNAFSKGALYHLLKNRVYLGETAHKGKIYAGEHQAILSQEMFDAVQATLGENRLARRSGKNAKSYSLLCGLIEDEFGRAMTPSHTNKLGQRYRYYVSVTDAAGEHAGQKPGLRLPATEIESVVMQELQRLLSDTVALMHHLGIDRTDIAASDQIEGVAQGMAKQLSLGGTDAATVVQSLVSRIKASASGVVIEVERDALAQRLHPEVADLTPDTDGSGESKIGSENLIILASDAQLQRHGAGKRLLLPAGADAGGAPDINAPLIRAVAQAYGWRVEIENRSLTIQDVADSAKVSRSLVSQQIALAYLAPDIVEAILDGCQPARLQLEQLGADLPLDWHGQRRCLLFKETER
jgi:site-specific DNA recombinase